MITLKDKVNIFKKMVLDQVSREYDAIQEKNEKKFEKEIDLFEKESKEKAALYIDKFITKAKQEQKKTLVRARRKHKNEKLALKNKLISSIYDSVLKKCREFTKTKEYLSVVEKLIVSIDDSIQSFDAIDVYLIEYDYEHNLEFFKEKISEIYDQKVYFKKAKENFCGGLMVFDRDRKIKLDVSLETIIGKNRNLIGNEVNKLINYSGDTYEK